MTSNKQKKYGYIRIKVF